MSALTAADARPGTGERVAQRRWLPGASIGTVSILWNNDDILDLAPPVPAEGVLGEMARLGYEGTELGSNYPAGRDLTELLARHDLRLAGAYVALPCSAEGPTPGAIDLGHAKLAALHAAGGEVLIVALDQSPGRTEASGRADAPQTPQLSEAGWRSLVASLETLGREAAELGHPLAFHNHTGTFVETPAELERLLGLTDPALVGLCLDLGHYTVGGGDAVTGLERHAERLSHIHLKDVDETVLGRLRGGQIADFREALRERIFTELGSGVLDLPGILRALRAAGYRGWIMVEQDTSWHPPSESAAIARQVLEYALKTLA